MKETKEKSKKKIGYYEKDLYRVEYYAIHKYDMYHDENKQLPKICFMFERPALKILHRIQEMYTDQFHINILSIRILGKVMK